MSIKIAIVHLKSRRALALEERAIIQKRIDDISTAITALEDACSHEWQEKGHGHNYVITKCIECGKEEHI